METKRETPHKRGVNIWIIIAAVVVVLAAAAGIIINQYLKNQEEQRQSIIQSEVFHDGISVDGVAIGGMRMEEAAQALIPVQEDMVRDVSFVLSYENEDASVQIPVDASAFGFTYDTEAVLTEAMALGRTGTLKELTAELADIAATGRSFSLTYAASEDTIRAFAKTVAEQVNTPPQDAQFILLAGNATQEDEASATPEPSATPETTPAPEASPDAGEASAQTAESMGFFRFEPDIDGLTVDEEALHTLLLDMAQSQNYGDAVIPMEQTKADMTLELLRDTISLRASATTSFAKSPYYRPTRVFNMVKAAGLINGTVLQPGEEFSTNGILGDRTYASGWKDAPAIVRGRSEDQAGGGVCQVSSTLYNAVLKGDLEVVYRQGHSGRLSYVDGGLDATIDSGRIDFKWKNNSDAPIYVFAWVDEANKKVHFELYGKRLEYDEIQLTSERVQRLDPPGEMAYEYDYSLAPGESEVFVERKSGSIWQSYASYIKDGEVVEKRKVDTTTYRAYAGVTHIGPPIGVPIVPTT